MDEFYGHDFADNIYSFIIYLFGRTARGILVPWPGIEPIPTA